MARRERGRVTRVSLIFVGLLKISLGLLLRFRYRLVTENLKILYRVKPPYVILPNHITTWDPFFIGTFVPGPVYNVTSDFQFRRRIMRMVHKLVGSIPKSKVIPDIETIKRIMEVRQKQGIIGIYPEGMRCWDGHTAETIAQTAKLLKFLKVPVISTVMKGAFLSLPRWSKHRRKGKVVITFGKLFSGPELARLSLGEIQGRIDEALRHDEYEYQQSQMLPYRCTRPAENLELVLFMCPSCESIGRLHSRGHRFHCEKCGYSVWYNDFGFLEPRKGELRFSTVRDWNLWQKERLEEVVAVSARGGGSETILSDHGLRMYVGYRTKPVRRRAVGEIRLETRELSFHPLKGEILRFPLGEIEGANVQIGECLEFYHGKVLYRFVSKERRVSGYKWMLAIEALQRQLGLSRPDEAI
ncbi:MAG TPA: lysophospholipid acyltransferase family protein [Spirochaetia bacterium]|nr:lysophospholipid acyltransferase family protein [Spirochaetia bacterium]